MLFDKKIGPLAKLNKRNKTRSKKIGDDVTSANCDVIIFPIYGQIGAFRKLDSGTVTFSFAKPENRAKKPLSQVSHCVCTDIPNFKF